MQWITGLRSTCVITHDQKKCFWNFSMVSESYESISWKLKSKAWKKVNIISDYVRLTPQHEIRKFVDLDWQQASDNVKKSISVDFELSVIGNDILCRFFVCLEQELTTYFSLKCQKISIYYKKLKLSCRDKIQEVTEPKLVKKNGLLSLSGH